MFEVRFHRIYTQGDPSSHLFAVVGIKAEKPAEKVEDD